MLTSSIFREQFGTNTTSRHKGYYDGSALKGPLGKTAAGVVGPQDKMVGVQAAITSSTIQSMADGFRHAIDSIDFNNTIELNSTIYFCRINHNEFNYSSNPTFTSAGRLVVKNNVTDLPVTYITTVGLYSPDNELLAVAKLSEPIRKDPNTELTLRVRLDY